MLATGMPDVVLLDLNGGYPNAGVGALTAAANRRNLSVLRVDVRRGDPLPPHPSAVMTTGGPGSPMQAAPWQAPLRAYLRRAVLQRTPLLTICFGFQVMCSELGSVVLPLAKERLGILPLRLTEAGHEDRWTGTFGGGVGFENRSFGVWGGDMRVLARGPAGDVLAARFGPRAVGAVFHPEAETASVEAWLALEESQRQLNRLLGAGAVAGMRRQALELGYTQRTLVGGFLDTVQGRPSA